MQVIVKAENFINKWAQSQPKQVAFTGYDFSLTWAELSSVITSVSVNALSFEIQKNEIVGLIGKNSRELVLLYLGLINIGAIPALISPQSFTQVENKLDNIKCRKIFLVAEDLSSFTAEEYKKLNNKYQVINSNFEHSPIPQLIPKSFSEQQQYVSIIFTSSSSGNPKAVVHSIDNHLVSAHAIVELMGFSQYDSWLLSLPIFHISGLQILWRWLLVGGELVLPKTNNNLFKDIAYVNYCSLVPTQLHSYLENLLIHKNVKNKLKAVLLGGAYIPIDLVLKAYQLGINCYLGYGLTEATATVCAQKFNPDLRINKEAPLAGKTLNGRKVKIINQQILIAGQTLAAGYWKAGKLTPLPTENGWFNTSDLGKFININGEEYLQVLGRADNMFISGGENVHCEEIEIQILKLVGVKFAFVIPVYDEHYGARPVGVVAIDRQKITFSEINEHLGKKLEKFKIPINYFHLPQKLLGEINNNQKIKLSRNQIKEWLFQEYPQYKTL